MITAKHLLDKIIQNNKLSHTYMFEGETVSALKAHAEYFALNILGNTPHNKVLIEERNHPDYMYVSTDENSIKKDDIETLVRQMYHKPIHGAYKVYIIESFEKLTLQAENSILKFLEEPPNNTIAILLTMDKSQILPTIHSRSQHIVIKDDGEDKTEALLSLKDHERRLINQLSLNIEHIEELDNQFSPIVSSVVKFTTHWLKNDSMALIDIIPMLEHCHSTRDYVLVLQLIDALLRQSLHQKMELEGFTPYQSIHINDIHPNITTEKLSSMLDEITKANQLIQSNVNPMLVFEGMVISSKG